MPPTFLLVLSLEFCLLLQSTSAKSAPSVSSPPLLWWDLFLERGLLLLRWSWPKSTSSLVRRLASSSCWCFLLSRCWRTSWENWSWTSSGVAHLAQMPAPSLLLRPARSLRMTSTCCSRRLTTSDSSRRLPDNLSSSSRVSDSRL